ncbi:MAG: hypothetical protein NTV62_02615 [Candidatus Gribaldobacteria bacterium]|nr:hypothetical protein [Candidatus Gribaldobacteria bacterium]
MPKDKKNIFYISLQQASIISGYSQEYLSLRSRQGKLKAKKIGRNWVTTKPWLRYYIKNVKNEENGKIKNENIFSSFGLSQSSKNNDNQENSFRLLAGISDKQDKRFQPDIASDIQTDTILKPQFFSSQNTAKRLSLVSVEKFNHPISLKNKNTFSRSKSTLGLLGVGLLTILMVGLGISVNSDENYYQEVYSQKSQFLTGSTLNATFSKIKKSSDLVIKNVLDSFERVVAEQQISQKMAGLGNKLGEWGSYLNQKKSLAINNFDKNDRQFENGIVVVPSSSPKEDEDLKKKVQGAFSDEVLVEPIDDNSGAVVPVFRDNKLGDRYLYMLVPQRP